MSLEILNKPTGWVPNPDGVEKIIRDTSVPVTDVTPEMRQSFNAMRSTAEKRTFLFSDLLLQLQPDWKRWAQGIGDCVSWGWELAGTHSLAIDIKINGVNIDWPGVLATEPLYGLMRVEALGKRSGGWQDGAFGAAGAKAVVNYGYLARHDYSTQTGNPEHDLRKYEGKKAKNWGNYGCGGENDKGKLDEIAKRYPCKEAIRVKGIQDGIKFLEAGYPIAVCSDVGFEGSRDRNGFKRARGTWYHCMEFFGVKYNERGEAVAVANAQSWGNSEGLDNAAEFATHPEVAKCSWWIDLPTANRMLSQGDSYAVTGINGFKPRVIDWLSGWDITGT